MSQDQILKPIQIAPEALSPEAFQGVLEDFISREGTDYGANELSLETKLNNLKMQIKRKEIVLVFDPNLESLTFLTLMQWRKLNG